MGGGFRQTSRLHNLRQRSAGPWTFESVEDVDRLVKRRPVSPRFGRTGARRPRGYCRTHSSPRFLPTHLIQTNPITSGLGFPYATDKEMAVRLNA